ncbi:MAG: HD domain-containing protein [candidate division KSB1 bacterium]|nr:HD domain-containing protein [candidate division KSB1 bacterium]MDZ7385263.1 HD domain-containing protein [candidate division KSB1 bacterium]MDZ7391779.1 HD domain-containing protein [candidate division KSB1 bacterium]MDZ7412649.1 HD domain-containing protein [candidate division KSB1 bacterium]
MELVEELQDGFPEINTISDSLLREKVAAVIADALSRGGWSVQDLATMPFTLLIPNCRVSYLTHVRAVTRVAIETARVLREHYQGHLTLNMDVLVAGALLHDVGKLLEFRRDQGGAFVKSAGGKLLRHPFSGAALAAAHGLPDEVVHIIAVHAKEGDGGYRSPEAIIVHHADFITFEPLRP